MVFTSRRRERLCSWPGTNMATVTSRANQQYLPLNLSNSRSSLKTLFRLRSRCSNGRGKGQIERVRARMAREGIRKWLRDSLPTPCTRPSFPFHPPSFTGPVKQAQLLDPPSDIFVSWSSSFTLIPSQVSFLLCLLSLSCTSYCTLCWQCSETTDC